VNAALTEAFDAAQALLIERLGSVTANDFERRFREL
jgi:hypothetical protein